MYCRMYSSERGGLLYWRSALDRIRKEMMCAFEHTIQLPCTQPRYHTIQINQNWCGQSATLSLSLETDIDIILIIILWTHKPALFVFVLLSFISHHRHTSILQKKMSVYLSSQMTSDWRFWLVSCTSHRSRMYRWSSVKLPTLKRE